MWWERIEQRLASLERDVAEILRLQRLTLKGELIIMTSQAEANAIIAALTDEVAQTKTVEESAVALMNGIPKLVADAVTAALAANPGVDLSALTNLSATLAAKRTELAAAITANTPAAPAPPADPPADPATSSDGSAPADPATSGT
jgi:hypothetical protein